MKCTACHKHWKHVRNLDHIVTVCPDCFVEPVRNTNKLIELFEEVLIHHVALAELRDVYRRHFNDILNSTDDKLPPVE